MNSHSSYSALEKRIFRKKNPALRFFCPLCRTERFMSSRPRLSRKNYLQIFLTTVITGLIAYPVMGFRSFYLFFIYWAGMELFVRLRFRKEIPCPHCGFDASWYKRDVKIARKFVDEFWQKKQVAKTEGVERTSQDNEYMPPNPSATAENVASRQTDAF